MMSLGYGDAARICLTHSFNDKRLESYVGRLDTTEAETRLIREKLQEADKALRPLPYKIGINIARAFLLRGSKQ